MRKFTGKKFEATKNMDIKDIAKLVRMDIATAKKAGQLPRLMKVSVSIERYSMGCSLCVTVKEWSGRVVNPAWCLGSINDPHGPNRAPRYTEQGTAWLEVLEAIANDYNYDNSDSETDCYEKAFSLHVGFAHIPEDAERQAQIDELKAVM